MTRLSLIVILFLTPGVIAAEEPQRQYGGVLSPPAKMRPELAAAVADLRATLGKVTGAEFALAPAGDTRGVVLRRADDPAAPAAALEQLPTGSQEACVLWPEADRLWLVARSDLGLAHAVYLYLEQLGCRWYFPAERWTILPRRNDIRLARPLAARPAFRSRVFAGSGGFGGNLPLDPKRELQQRWTDWQRRNRFGGEFRVAGHSGEAFNTKYRQQLEAHPEWRAMVKGERAPWSLITKFCPGNPEVVALYVQDRVQDLKTRRQRDAEDPHAWAVSVEPADGGGHCSAPESLALGSVSDRVFHVANEVARAVRKEIPDGRVSLFAYNEHAAVPSIPLEPNVYVQVIPYAFQRTGLTPDQLLDAWSRKVDRMGVYDYWSIPDWSHDLPSFDPLRFGPQRLGGWHARGVDSFLCESTYSSGAMGPAWFIASRLAWQPEADAEPIFHDFLRDSFGPAEEPLRRMLLRWADRFTLTSHELALSFRNLAEASQLAERDPAAAARVADYGRYVQYLRLVFERQQAPRGSAEKRAAAERLMRHLWSIYDSSMIHAFRLSQLLARDERNAGNAELADAFDWQKKDAPGWASIRPLTDDDVRRLVAAGVADFQPQDFFARRFAGPLVPLPDAPRFTAMQDPVLALNNSLEMNVLAEAPGDVFRPRIATELPVQVIVSGPDGKSVATLSVATGAEWLSSWSQPEIVLPQRGVHRVQIVSQKRPFRFSPPSDVRLSLPGWTNSQGAPTPRLYFYVPQGTTRLAIYTNYVAAGPPRYFDSDGAEVKPQLVDGGHLQLIAIPAEQRGRIWSLDRAKCPIGALELLNAPASFAFHPAALLVPRDAVK